MIARLALRTSYSVSLMLLACGARPTSPDALDVARVSDATIEVRPSDATIEAEVYRFAGTGECRPDALAGPRLKATLQLVRALEVSSEGDLFFASLNQVAVVRDDMVRVIAGRADISESVDGPTNRATFTDIYALTIGGSGKLYVGQDHVLRVVDGGDVRTVAGFPGDARVADGRGKESRLQRIRGLAAADGDVIIADWRFIRRYSSATDRLRTVAGNGEVPSSGSKAIHGPALTVPLYATDVAPSDEDTYFGQSDRIMLLRGTGVITALRGYPHDPPRLVDGGPDEASFLSVGPMANVRQGLLFADGRRYLRVFSPSSVSISTVSSTDLVGRDSGLLHETRFGHIADLAVAPNGTVYIADECRILATTAFAR